ncbi:glycosyltransferase family 4 protein [Muricoccus radiodurans]|uniref:glycosyltransferase family 4 protein n=1 Tax=Muricoccus radiodurans TaxID=2231721 RepID=UPI003CEF6C32
MRIAIVMCHAERRMEGARRELHLLRALGERGVAVRLFRIHGGEAEEEGYLDGQVTAAFFPADNPEEPHARRVSTPMLYALSAFRPDLVLYKGLFYAIPSFLQERLWPQPAFSFIVGGAVTDPLLGRAAMVLAEHDVQAERAFPAHHAAGRTLILPKFFDAALCGDGAPNPAARHDIINVGTFHGVRKNQAALLPLSRRHVVGFVGGGARLEEVKAMAPPKNRARFHGHRPPDRVYGYLLDSRIMVHPALQEGFPRAAVEAMACGRPVVAYRHVIPSGIVHGEHGLLVTPETLEAEVEALLADPARIEAMGRAAFAHAHTNHGAAAIGRAADRLLDLAGRLGA